ncbi:hypothetical protein IHE45_09G030200 [Dioscorea alata]|uniref:Uncharacterized protein n=1 Tax=Dioscorea alata TaxID=55571 RepID=A0ACB7VE90_DIOAL|nr:hypothetical protein IHE45_09G030200 [Dioscorea alata]
MLPSILDHPQSNILQRSNPHKLTYMMQQTKIKPLIVVHDSLHFQTKFFTKKRNQNNTEHSHESQISTVLYTPYSFTDKSKHHSFIFLNQYTFYTMLYTSSIQDSNVHSVPN